MQKEIQSKSVEIENIEMNQDFYQITENNKNVTPFMQLFWEQEKLHAKNNPKAIKYHPMIIRFCISLAAKSASTYDELRNTGILTLPVVHYVIIQITLSHHLALIQKSQES